MLSLNQQKKSQVLSFDRWRQSVLGDINRHTTVTDHIYVFYNKYRILETSCEERICHCGYPTYNKANKRIEQIDQELFIQKTLGPGYQARCDDCGNLFPVFYIRLGGLPKVLHTTESYTPHCSRKILDFDVWKLEVDKDNYSFAFWYNQTLIECILEYTNIQLYDLETTHPNPNKYLSLSLNEFMREVLYKRYVSWTRFLDRWRKLFLEFEEHVKQEQDKEELQTQSLRERIESGL